MSNFLHRGKREKIKREKKDIKKRLKHIHKVLDELNDIVLAIDKDNKLDSVDKDNIVEVVSEYSSLLLGEYEINILLSKIEHLKNIKSSTKNATI